MVLVLAACGSTGVKQASAPTSTSAHGSPSASSSFPPRNLTPQLLTVADLPAGWVAHNASSSGSVNFACLQKLKAAHLSLSKASAGFIQGSGFPLLQQRVVYYGTSARAITSYTSGVAELNNCTGVSGTGGGFKFTGSIDALSFPKMGDESSAWQIALSSDGYSFGCDVVVVRKGPELTLILYGDLGTPDITAATSLVRTAIAKMPAV